MLRKSDAIMSQERKICIIGKEKIPLRKGDTGSVPEDTQTRTSQAVDLL